MRRMGAQPLVVVVVVWLVAGWGAWGSEVLVLPLEAGTDLGSDADALLALKEGVDSDPTQVLSGWDAGRPVCGWRGVSCSQVVDAAASGSAGGGSMRVTGLNLAGGGLKGQLPFAALSRLPALLNLSLSNNLFYGTLEQVVELLPLSPSNCSTNLNSLDLSYNTVNGPLPSALFSSPCLRLTFLSLASNNLSGHIPLLDDNNSSSAPAAPLPFQSLDLSHNSLSADIPASLFTPPSSLRTLNLSFNDFTGPIPSQLFSNCSLLQLLDLSGNQLSEEVPAGIGKCGQLLHLNFSSNRLSGPPPPELLSGAGGAAASLKALDLSQNNFTGPLYMAHQELVYVSLAQNSLSGALTLLPCSSLQSLDLSDNAFSALLPSPPLPLPSLLSLSLAGNNFSGSLPVDLASLFPSLEQLDLSSNHLQGPLPLSLPPSLLALRLADNNFTGELPTDYIFQLCASGLQVLGLAFNYFSGQLPPELLLRCPQLVELDLSSNLISGSVPPELCTSSNATVPALQVLSLPNNYISGGIPAEVGRCIHLRTLDVSFNLLVGAIPPEVGQLVELEYLFLWSNQLNGTIPESLGNCRKLKGLILNYNLLSGNIPPQLAACTQLLWLSLNTNFLDGPIPPQIGQMQKLAILQLGNNSLSGAIPRELGNCTSLIWLDLNSNQLSGSIPSPIGRRVDNSLINPDLEVFRLVFVKNIGLGCQGIGGLMEFAGIRLDVLSTAPRLVSCNFTRLFSGSGGSNFYNWRSDSSIEYLDLSYNHLQAGIPDDFGNMRDLHVLNLAHNNLSGPLPPSLGYIHQLESLILSHNNLSGSIPSSYGLLTFLSYLDLSDNSLSGPIPSGGQLDTFPPYIYANNSGLCGQAINTSCSRAASGAAASQQQRQAGGRRKHGLWNWPTILLLLLLVSAGLLLLLLLACLWSGKRWWPCSSCCNWHLQQQHRGSLEGGHDRISSWNTSDWKSGYGREPLSINVATFQRPLRRLTFANLLEATNGFSEDSIIGAGGFGEVYKAELPDGTVAVKKLIHSSFQGDREFAAEMETLGKIKHHNLVPLLGYCKVGQERLLVYEFMACGSLEHILHDHHRHRLSSMATELTNNLQQQQQQQQQAKPRKVGNTGLLTPPPKLELDWELRRQVAMGAARGLAFLHHSCIPHIIHRDMKSSNVLLDHHLVARVSDFGMARLISASDTHLSVSTLAGTPGYVPPEYYQSFRCTTKGDVYSFGVVLLELLTGKRPTNKEEFGDSNLVGWVKLLVSQKRSTQVLDPQLLRNHKSMEQDMLHHLRIACMCVHDLPSRRPTMIQVVAMFKELHLDSSAS